MLYLKAMEVVRMGNASAESFEHTYAGLEALLISGTPLAEKRDSLGFEDRLAGLVRVDCQAMERLYLLEPTVRTNAIVLGTLLV